VIVWVVSVGDTERNFPRRRDAVAWLVRLTHDTRPTPRVHRETSWRYRYYGPGDDLRFVAIAVIDKLAFPPRRFYAPKKLRKKRREESEVLAASDPHAPDPGRPSTRV
jgi:hypothetical protein